MASKGLGSLTLDLILKLAGFEQGWDKAARITDRRAREIEKRAFAMGKAMGGALRSAATGLLAFTGATVSVAAGINAIKSAIDRADNIRDLSIRLGISTEKLSGFSYAAKQTGTDLEDLNKGLLRLSKNAATALDPKSRQANLFEALGVSKDALTDLDKLLPQVADGFSQIQDGGLKAAIAQELFGKSGAKLIEFLNQGSAGLSEMADRAAELGLIISQDTANAADAFNDKLEDLRSAGTGLATQIAAELLPQLTEIVDWAVEFVNDGDNAKEAVDSLVVAFDGVVSIGSSVISTLESVRGVLGDVSTNADDSSESLRQLVQSARGLAAIPASMAAFFEANTTLDPSAQAAAARRFRDANREISAGFSGKPPERGATEFLNPFADVNSGRTRTLTGREFQLAQARAKRQKEAEDRLLGFFKDPTPSTGGGKKSGKSDAEKEAEKIARAIEQMTKAQQDWQNELAKTGNPIADEYASRLREITEQAKGFAEDGVPAEKVKAFTDEMQKLATSLRDADIAEFQKEFNEATDQMAASLQGPMQQALFDYQVQLKEIDELLKLGIITIEEYNARLAILTQQRDEPVTGMLDSIREEILLLGMSAEQQEIYNNLKRAGVDASTASGQAIIEETKALQAFREEAAFMEDLKAGLSNMFVDFVSGAKSAKEAFGDFADAIYARALQFLADKAIQALFDSFKSPGTGSTSSGSSSGWGNIISGFLSAFGGGRASGGMTQPGMFYRVNERGTELATINGNDYLMMGANAAKITPSHELRGSGINQQNAFYLAAPEKPETQQQIASRMSFELAQARRRNG